jgi:hypothetical protein
MEDNEIQMYKNHELLIASFCHRKIGRYRRDPISGEDAKGFFAFIKAAYDEKFYEEDVSLAPVRNLQIGVRCDSDAPKEMPVPAAIHEKDENTGVCKICGSDKPIYGTTNSHHASLSNTRMLRIPFHGYKGFIAYLELHDSEIEETDVYENPNVARTLQELFKLMLEWDWVYNNLDSEDICAVLSHNILEELDMPQILKDWIWEKVPDMHVAKFLKGDLDARARPSILKIPAMIPEFEGWCWYNIYTKPNTWNYGVR